MGNTSRRTFLKNASLVGLGWHLPLHNLIIPAAGYQPKLAFSTLGCPAWTIEEIVLFAAKHRYQGVELRGILNEMDLTKCVEFSPSNIAVTSKLFTDNLLTITDLGSSASMHFIDAATRQKNMDEGKRFIDLASALDCKFIRVFPNNLPKNQDARPTLDVIANGLTELGNYATKTGVMVLMETHGDVVKSADIAYVMSKVDTAAVGLVWDFYNMWIQTKEPIEAMYKRLTPYIHHVHVKDGKMVDGKEQYTLLGRGEAPVKQAIQLLNKNKFKGFYSFEWEKRWHPEIEAPEVAIADYPVAINQYFS